MELCREVGVTFEAVLASKSSECLQTEPQAKVSFTERIEELQADIVKLTNELNQWRDQAVYAKEELNRLKITMQAARRQDAQKMALLAKYYRNITIKSFQEMNGVFERFGLPSFSNGQIMDWTIPRDAFYQSKETKPWEVAETGDQVE
jgi:hypothetical protein